MSTLKTTNIAHPSSASNNIVLDSSGNVVLQAGSASTPALQPTGDTNTGIFFPAADTIAFAEGGAEAARIDSSGRLLVGTSTAPIIGSTQFRFNVSGENFAESGSLQVRYESLSSGPTLLFAKARGTTASPSIVQNGDELGKIRFYGYDSNDFSPHGAEIAADVDGTPGSNDMPGRLVFSTTADGAASPTERMRISSEGGIFLGTTGTPNGTSIYGASFEPVSNNRTLFRTSTSVTTATTLCVFINGNGQVGSITVAGSATSYNTSSDYRLKENVTPVTDGIIRLQQLKPSRFNFIADPDTVVDGFLAHEVQTIVPEAITGEKDAVDADGNPEYQGIDQSKLVPLLTAALQEAVAKIESLESRLTAAGI